MIFFRNPSLEELMAEAKKVTDYEAKTTMLCGYAINRIARGANGHLEQRCKAIITLFGDGLPREAIPKHAFCKRIMLYHVKLGE